MSAKAYRVYAEHHVLGRPYRVYLHVSKTPENNLTVALGCRYFSTVFASHEEAYNATSYFHEFSESFLVRYGYPRVEESDQNH